MTTIASEWAGVLARRPAFRDALQPLGRIIDAWDSWPVGDVSPLPGTREGAAQLWARGEPLLQNAPPCASRDDLEPLLVPALDLLAEYEDTHFFVEAWDRGEILPDELLPIAGRFGSTALQQRCRLTHDALALLSLAALRPALTAYLAIGRSLLEDGRWSRGTCPCCGAPPGCADLLEDGRRQLACHLCDARWTFARLICPLCGNHTAADFIRVLAEGEDEGYAISVCRACRGYVKEFDRRERWNAGGALVEDWGSPHLDLIAQRQQYWRPPPTLVRISAIGQSLR